MDEGRKRFEKKEMFGTWVEPEKVMLVIYLLQFECSPRSQGLGLCAPVSVWWEQKNHLKSFHKRAEILHVRITELSSEPIGGAVANIITFVSYQNRTRASTKEVQLTMKMSRQHSLFCALGADLFACSRGELCMMMKNEINLNAEIYLIQRCIMYLPLEYVCEAVLQHGKGNLNREQRMK